MIRTKRVFDPILLLLAILTTVAGLVLVFDAGFSRSVSSGRGPIPSEFRQQLLFVPIALAAGWAMSFLHPAFLRKASLGIGFLSLLSLLAVKAFGHEQNGAQRWIDFGPVSVQPAEFAKLAAILFLAGCFADRKPWSGPARSPKDWAEWLDLVALPKLGRAVPAIAILVAVILIEKEPDLGTASVIAATAFGMFVCAGVSWKSLLGLVVVGSVGVVAMVQQEPYRMERIEHHAHRWNSENIDDAGYQTVQSELAMASGGAFGVGPGAGRAKHVLPATTTDFILATVGEEFGMLGVTGLLLLLGSLTLRLFILAGRATTRYSRLVLSGVGLWIGVQTVTNVLMANGALPAIGIPLPLISSGGSSLVAIWMAIGVCQSMLTPIPSRSNVLEEEANGEADRNRWRNGRTRLSGA
jgi:cell division protein FtsW (lipid II flippase)